MLCVWGKKKLELEQRQQLGGGGAQSIKVESDEKFKKKQRNQRHKDSEASAEWGRGPEHQGRHTIGGTVGRLKHQGATIEYDLTIVKIYICQVLKDRLLVAVSEYILVLDHSCQVSQG